MIGFVKLEKLIKSKNTRLVLGIDPDIEEVKAAKGDLEGYLKSVIDECAEYVVAVKPQLAFYEKSPEWRQIAMNVMDYAGKKYGLIKILDVKRGDIANTQSNWAHADINNFRPDIVVVNAYMGGKDVIQPYLDADKNLCVYVLTATSNPSARDFQDLLSGGLLNYQQMALHARSADQKRVGYVVGGTKIDAIKNIRMLERENNMTEGHALCPGFGRQGADLQFVKHAGNNAIYSVSSGLTNAKYLNGKKPGEAAKWWRDEINRELKNAVPTMSVKEYVATQLVEKGLIIAPKSDDFATWPFLKAGKDKLKNAGVKWDGSVDQLRKFIKDGIIGKNDFTNLFLNLRNLMAFPELRRLMAYLYVQMIQKSGTKVDRVASIAYGAINTGDLVSYFLDKPTILLRKERGQEPTHSDLLGEIKSGESIVMIEDVATTGNSLIRDVKMLRETFGVQITDAFIFCKRTEESEKNYRDNGLKMHYIVDMPTLRKLVGIK
ncbi:MAG: orotidine-5'-phosphate decarboxylase [Firmicutes bacterium]|nr:orotidine-5'-phosphate decarboxylase [Bacillota bacterium]